MLIGAGIVVICLVGAAGFALKRMITPTQGAKIETYSSPRKALFVIDVQEDYTGKTSKSPYKNAEQLISTINQVAEHAAQQQFVVVYIRQEFATFGGKLFSTIFSGRTAIQGQPGAEIDARVAKLSNHIFSKPIGDAFSNPTLDIFLREQQVNELYITGLDGIFCVDKTIQGAVNRSYRITVVTDGVATKFEKQWQKLLRRYEQKGITLTTSQKFLEQP